ncbi:MAG: hypothetical protein AAB221_06045 [Bacteroidota bacterium]
MKELQIIISVPDNHQAFQNMLFLFLYKPVNMKTLMVPAGFPPVSLNAVNSAVGCAVVSSIPIKTAKQLLFTENGKT